MYPLAIVVLILFGLSQIRIFFFALKFSTKDSVVHDYKPTLKENRDWCPQASCNSTDVCHPCSRRFLLVLATGRSASTTLKNMLRNLPGVRMAGENDNALRKIKDMITALQPYIDDHRLTNLSSWQHNPIPSQAFACVAQQVVETIVPPLLDEAGHVLEDDSSTVLGFKTIRFLQYATREHDEPFVNFVKNMFPCSKIVVNIRSDTNAQVKSRVVAFNEVEENARKRLDEENDRLRTVAKLFGDMAIFIDSSKWTKDANEFNKVVDWLGFHESCRFKELLHFNANQSSAILGSSHFELSPSCKYVT